MTRKNIRQTKRRRKYKLNSNKTMSEYDYIIDVLNSLFKQRFDIIKSIHDSTIINIDKEDYEDYKTPYLIEEWMEIFEHYNKDKQDLIDKELIDIRNKDDKRQYLLNKLNDYQDNITQEQLSEEFMLGIKQEIGKSSDFKLILTELESRLKSYNILIQFKYILNVLMKFITKLELISKTNDIVVFQSFMLQELMNPYNWDVYNDIKIEYNILYMIDKKRDNKLNFYSIFEKYDKLAILYDTTSNYESQIISYNSKKKLIKYISNTISPNIIQKYNIKSFNKFYNAKRKEITFKEICERDLLDILYSSVQLDYMKSFKTPLILSKSHIMPLLYEVNTYNFFNKKYTPEHSLYLFFKDVLKMKYYPNPTSNPQHEKEIMRILKKYKFKWVDNYTTNTNKTNWYTDRRLKPGQFVEQPNGSTSHPDFWIQLTNMRLSLEAKSNQGFNPMYGKTPPPEEVVYIFSSKKNKYPDTKVKNGRTTFVFGSALLEEDIRNIMNGSKNNIKLIGKKLDWEISSLNNHSGISLKSDTDFTHYGSNSNYWKDNRNFIREQQVLSYNWLEPQGICDSQIKSYTCIIPELVNKTPRYTRQFECIGKKNKTCSCTTHVSDFEQKSSFSGNTFNELIGKGIINPSYYKFSIGGETKFWCYMCVMKYYTVVNRDEYEIDSITDILAIGPNIYYKIKYRNYKEESWQWYNKLIQDVDKYDVLFENFWTNISTHTKLKMFTLPPHSSRSDKSYFSEQFIETDPNPFYKLIKGNFYKTSFSTILQTKNPISKHINSYLKNFNPIINKLLLA